MNVKQTSMFIAVMLVLIVIGAATGRWLGIQGADYLFKGGLPLQVVITDPGASFIGLYRSLFSPDAYRRLAAYYSLEKAGLARPSFIEGRFEQEKDTVMKSTLAWIACRKFDANVYLSFSDKFFSSADERSRREIVRCYRERFPDRYEKLIKGAGLKNEDRQGSETESAP